jgi:hypothetical protein
MDSQPFGQIQLNNADSFLIAFHSCSILEKNNTYSRQKELICVCLARV